MTPIRVDHGLIEISAVPEGTVPLSSPFTPSPTQFSRRYPSFSTLAVFVLCIIDGRFLEPPLPMLFTSVSLWASPLTITASRTGNWRDDMRKGNVKTKRREMLETRKPLSTESRNLHAKALHVLRVTLRHYLLRWCFVTSRQRLAIPKIKNLMFPKNVTSLKLEQSL